MTSTRVFLSLVLSTVEMYSLRAVPRSSICNLFRRSAAISAITHNDGSATPKQDTQGYQEKCSLRTALFLQADGG
ncbi:hypothetical protein BJX65DRAFT_270019 [Aspergillus insuetus]